MKVNYKLSITVLLFLPLLVGLTYCGGSGGRGGGENNSGPVASAVVGAAGGTVTVTDASSPLFGTQVIIPAGALVNSTTITISDETGLTGLPADVLVIDMGPTGTVFLVPVTITIKYSAKYLTDNNIIDPTTLKVVLMDSGVASETLGTISQNIANDTITTETTHFSNFAALGYTDTTASGSYTGVSFTYNNAITQSLTPATGSPLPPPLGFSVDDQTFVFDGAGNWTSSGTKNQDGVTSPTSSSGTYSVAVNGTYTSSDGGTGGILAGGSTIVYAYPSGSKMKIGIGIKQGGGSFSNASLTGNYTGISFTYDNSTIQSNTPAAGSPLPAPLGFSVDDQTFVFDGNGNFTASGTKDKDGTSSATSSSGTYSVAADGTFTSSDGGTGTVLAGGSVIVYAYTSGSKMKIGMGIQQGGSFSNATANGNYTGVSFTYDNSTIQSNTPPTGSTLPVPLGFTVDEQTFVFDGAGNWTSSGTKDKDGTSSATSSSGTYSVAADGTYTSSDGGTGAVLADGSMIIYAYTSGSKMKIGVGIRL